MCVSVLPCCFVTTSIGRTFHFYSGILEQINGVRQTLCRYMIEAYRFGMITVFGIAYIVLRFVTGGHKTSLMVLFACLIGAIKDDLQSIYPRLHWTLILIALNTCGFVYLKKNPGHWQPVMDFDSRDLFMHGVFPLLSSFISISVAFHVTNK